VVIEASSPDEPESAATAEPELRGPVLDVLRTLLGDHQERDAVMSIFSQLVARNTDLERLHVRTALMRKNFLFAGSDAGGERAAIAYSIIGSCRSPASIRASTSQMSCRA
jgi:hypothetical protein